MASPICRAPPKATLPAIAAPGAITLLKAAELTVPPTLRPILCNDIPLANSLAIEPASSKNVQQNRHTTTILKNPIPHQAKP